MIKKILLSISFFLIFSVPTFAATFHFSNTGNWATAASYTENSGYPVAGDTVIFDAGSAGKTLTLAANAACAVLDMTGNTTGVLALATYKLTTTGNITLVGNGSNITGTTGSIIAGGSFNLTSNTLSIPNLTFNLSGTYMLGDNLSVTGTLTFAASSPIFAGAYDISCSTLTNNYSTGSLATLTLVTGRTLTVGSYINLSSLGFNTLTIQSSTGTATNLVYNGTAANSKVSGVTFTNVTVTGTGAPIYNWFGSGTNTTGITNVTNTSIGGTGGGAWGF